MFSTTKFRTAVVVLAAALSLSVTAVPASAQSAGSGDPTYADPDYCNEVLNSALYHLNKALEMADRGDYRFVQGELDEAAYWIKDFIDSGCSLTRQVEDMRSQLRRLQSRVRDADRSPSADGPKGSKLPHAGPRARR